MIAYDRRCLDCIEPLPAQDMGKGRWSPRCEECRKTRRRKVARESSRRIRAAIREGVAKLCVGCNEPLPDRTGRGGKLLRCETCGEKWKREAHRELSKRHYEANAGLIVERTRLWRQANPERFREQARQHAHRRRSQERGAFIENVDRAVLFKRDKGRCGLCGKKVNPKLRGPNPKSASVDHVIPLAEGGEHSYRNTQLAHLGCNVSKNVKPMGEQLRLVG